MRHISLSSATKAAAFGEHPTGLEAYYANFDRFSDVQAANGSWLDSLHHMAINALALACLVQSRNLAVVALLIEHLQREQYTSEELDAEEQTSEHLGSQDCTSRELAAPTKSRLDPVSNTLEQLRNDPGSTNRKNGSSGPMAKCNL